VTIAGEANDLDLNGVVETRMMTTTKPYDATEVQKMKLVTRSDCLRNIANKTLQKNFRPWSGLREKTLQP